jgi:hypothetical protein
MKNGLLWEALLGGKRNLAVEIAKTQNNTKNIMLNRHVFVYTRI